MRISNHIRYVRARDEKGKGRRWRARGGVGNWTLTHRQIEIPKEGMQVDPSRIQIRASPWILTFDSEIPGAGAGSIKVQTIRCLVRAAAGHVW